MRMTDDENDLTPQEHERESRPHVGVSFVDVLFALVIGRILTQATDARSLPAPATAHLVVAVVLTICSWVGYHNSSFRPQERISFFNLAFWQFLVDIVLVGLYWLVATTAEYVPATGRPNGETSAVPETLGVAGSFALYVIWDQISRRINADPNSAPQEKPDYARRRRVSVVFLCMSAAVTIGVLLLKPTRPVPVISVDAALVVVLIMYRVAKDHTWSEMWPIRISLGPKKPAT